jgi:hypothetical protein
MAVWYKVHVQSVPITTKVVSSNPVHSEMYLIQHYVIKFVSHLRQVGGFLRFPLPRYNWNIVESGVKHHEPQSVSIMVCKWLRRILVLFEIQDDHHHIRTKLTDIILWEKYMYMYVKCLYILLLNHWTIFELWWRQ